MGTEENKGKEFLFLDALYKVTKGKVNIPINMFSLGILLDLSYSDVEDIVSFLESEGLVTSKSIGGTISGKVAITHEGKKKIIHGYEKTSKVTEKSVNIVNIIGEVKGDLSMGDIFKDIANSTIINKANVKNAFNKIDQEHGKDYSESLLKITEFLMKENNPAAGALFNQFNQELTNPQPRKTMLEKFVGWIQKVLPSAVSLATEFTKIISLIQ